VNGQLSSGTSGKDNMPGIAVMLVPLLKHVVHAFLILFITIKLPEIY
jgi:hypothetical protein